VNGTWAERTAEDPAPGRAQASRPAAVRQTRIQLLSDGPVGVFSRRNSADPSK
jgi:hypothetical protein